MHGGVHGVVHGGVVHGGVHGGVVHGGVHGGVQGGVHGGVVQRVQELQGQFRCGVGGCTYRGASAFALEAHNAAAHGHVCSTCRRILPTARLLELHVLETHDVLFKLMAERERMVGAVRHKRAGRCPPGLSH